MWIDARSLWTAAPWDDVTCPRLTKKTNGGVVDSVKPRHNMTLLHRIFNGSTSHNGRSMEDWSLVIVWFTRLSKIYRRVLNKFLKGYYLSPTRESLNKHNASLSTWNKIVTSEDTWMLTHSWWTSLKVSSESGLIRQSKMTFLGAWKDLIVSKLKVEITNFSEKLEVACCQGFWRRICTSRKYKIRIKSFT